MSIVAAIQMVSTDNVTENLQLAAELISQAVEQGAQFVCLPENFALMSANEKAKVAAAEALGAGQIQSFLSAKAAQHQIIINAGTIPLQSPQDDKVFASSLLFGQQGELLAHYNKIHLFDVTVDVGESYCESDAVIAGENIIIGKTSVGNIGLSVCYDLRFPELYRTQLLQGAQILCVPAAFTDKTGRAHWEVLLRARAIENLSYVIASNQGGTHPGGRETYGHSMIISPWGEVLASCAKGNAVITAEIDLQGLDKIRQQFPATSHIKLFATT